MKYLHEHVLDRLNAHLDRTLSRTDSVIVKRHCDHCASCREALKQLIGRARKRLFKRLGPALDVLLADSCGSRLGPGRHPGSLRDAEAIAVRPPGAGSDRVAAGHGRVDPLAGPAARRQAGTRRAGHGRADGSEPGRGPSRATGQPDDRRHTAWPSRASGCPTGPTVRTSCRSRPVRAGLPAPRRSRGPSRSSTPGG